MKKVFKYATGAEIPEGAIYLSTVAQTNIEVEQNTHEPKTEWVNCWLVWHYFLVEIA